MQNSQNTPSNPGWTNTGVVDMQGNAYYKGSQPPLPPANDSGGSGGDGGDPMKTPFDILKHNVDLLNKIVGGAIVVFLSAFVGLYFALDLRIGSQFDKADEKIGTVSEQVTNLRVDIAKQDSKLEKILEKVDAPKSQESAGTR